MRNVAASLSLSLGLSLLSLASAQSPELVAQVPSPTEANVVPGSYLIRFATRSFDLDEYSEAIRAGRSAAAVAEIVGRMEAAVRSDQARWVREIESLGGRVAEQWWIINGLCAHGLSEAQAAALRGMPGVEAVEPNTLHYPVNNTARNATHHNAAAANARVNGLGQTVTGTGVSVAVIDTGIDALYQATGKPNPAYYPGANQANATGGGLQGSRVKALFDASGFGTEDFNGHGSHVAGSIASDHASFRGMAPNAWIVGIRISGSGTSGSASSAALVSAWQTVAAQRVAHNIKVANNSFSGSPSLTDSIQMALDNTAFSADILACCAAGNSGANTASSQMVWNGLAVGSIDKNTLAVSSFSGTGPLDGPITRTYPDITAVGAAVLSVRIETNAGTSLSGTSMATPMAAGGGALLRQAVPAITALQAKAVLLNTTKHTQTSRNTYGLGVMDCDAAVAQALAGDYYTLRMSSGTRVVSRNISFGTTGTRKITATWMHPAGGSFDNVDLRIYNGATLVASDLNTLNSYEKVSFTATANVSYRLELTWTGTAVRPTLDVAIAGISDTPPSMPSLTSLTPNQATNSSAALVTLNGSFDRIDRINLGATQITSFTAVNATQLTFTLPNPALIGTIPVSVTNVTGTSNTLNLQVDGTHPARLVAPPITVRNVTFNLSLTGDAAWDGLFLLSPSNLPSQLPGIVNLGIADNFTSLFVLGVSSLNGSGYGTYPFIFPVATPTGSYHFQAIHLNPANITIPLEVSSVASTTLF